MTSTPESSNPSDSSSVRPYDPSKLTWNVLHTQNSERKYCYCGSDRTLHELTLQCDKCLNWFHAKCIGCPLGPVVPFIFNYNFCCNWCGTEAFERHQPGWKAVITTALAHFIVTNTPEKYFGKTDIVPWIDKNWKAVCFTRDRTPTWWATIGSALYGDDGTFICKDPARSAASKYTLAESNLLDLRPIRSSSVSSTQRSTPKRKAEDTGSSTDSIHREKKRRQPRQNQAQSVPQELIPKLKGMPTEHPFNRDGYRYTLAEPDPVLNPKGDIVRAFRERVLEYGVFISREDRSPFIQLERNRLTAWTEKGYRMARATHSVSSGCWYFEVHIEKSVAVVSTNVKSEGRRTDGPHTRLGWARQSATLEAPVGYDAYGYSYRDKTGDKVHLARPEEYGEPAEEGDVIGLLIDLPKTDRRIGQTPSTKRQRCVIRFKQAVFFEEKDVAESESQTRPKCVGSKIVFYKNGKSMGTAFSDIEDGEYFPAFSLYRGAKITVNFGAKPFAFPPADVAYRPFVERDDELAALRALQDMVDEVEAGYDDEKEQGSISQSSVV